jgi:hypothetical protein
MMVAETSSAQDQIEKNGTVFTLLALRPLVFLQPIFVMRKPNRIITPNNITPIVLCRGNSTTHWE